MIVETKEAEGNGRGHFALLIAFAILIISLCYFKGIKPQMQLSQITQETKDRAVPLVTSVLSDANISNLSAKLYDRTHDNTVIYKMIGFTLTIDSSSFSRYDENEKLEIATNLFESFNKKALGSLHDAKNVGKYTCYPDNRRTILIVSSNNNSYQYDYQSIYGDNPYFNDITGNNSSSEQNTKDALNAKICAEKVVKDNLKAPSSAKFCNYSEMQATNISGKKWKITGYVDAQNSFGTMLRQNWIVTLTLTDNGFTDYSVSFS